MLPFDLAKAHFADLQKHRRALHQIPELGWHEEKTLAYLKKELSLVGLISKELPSGLIVDIEVKKGSPFLLCRADIDGLPIEEKTDLPFASNHKGVMHACGHDFHAATLLVFAELIAKKKVIPKRNLRLFWQRAEETFNDHGAKRAIEEGLLGHVEEALALHIGSLSPLGEISSKAGAMLACCHLLQIDIETLGGHLKNQSNDPSALEILVDIQMALRGLESAFFEKEGAIFTPTLASAGSAHNIVPNKASITYALRGFFSEAKACEFVTMIESHLHAKIPKLKMTLSLKTGVPTLINESKSYQSVKKRLTLEGLSPKESTQSFAGEDFSYILQKVAGSYWCIGAKSEKSAFDHHTPYFNPDERGLIYALAFWVATAMNSKIKQ